MFFAAKPAISKFPHGKILQHMRRTTGFEIEKMVRHENLDILVTKAIIPAFQNMCPHGSANISKAKHKSKRFEHA